MERNSKIGSMKPAAKLKVIENTLFRTGNRCIRIYDLKGDNATLRMAVAAYRTSMQAMRDQSRYQSVPVKKKKS